MQRGRITLDLRIESKSFADAHDRHAVVADRAAAQDRVARLHRLTAHRHAVRHDADA